MADERKEPPSEISQHSVVVDQEKEQDAVAASGATTSTAATRTTNVDSFLSSMTFASLRREDRISSGACDCDECGFGTTSGGNSTIPTTILQALHRYKKRKLESSPMKRTQNRTLDKRCLATSVAVWTWTMPRGAEPLVEFGNSHRIIWVQRLPQKSIMKAIGKGILGSSQEEKDRTVMDDWKEGGVYLVPANGGKAVGWIHEEQTESTLSSSSSSDAKNHESSFSASGPVVLVMAKIPMDSLTAATDHDEREDEECDPTDAWSRFILNCCVAAFKEQGYSSSSVTLSPFQFSEKDTILLKENMS